MYERRRNIVVRPDGKRVNVARFRGQLFVCADGCCCGDTAQGFPAVPRDLYHQEWERRRLRNIVHLTIGGCLGPCALANVVQLVIDGHVQWFNSMDSPDLVTALYDHIETMLEAGTVLAPAGPLADRWFTAATWQPRPDGQPVDDHRRKRLPFPEGGGRGTVKSCDSNQPQTPQPDTPAIDRTIADMTGPAAAPRKNGELVFAAPWEARAFGMAVALSESGAFEWETFRHELIQQIAVAERSGRPFVYYECWLQALEAVLARTASVTPDALEEVTWQFEFGERDEVF